MPAATPPAAVNGHTPVIKPLALTRTETEPHAEPKPVSKPKESQKKEKVGNGALRKTVSAVTAIALGVIFIGPIGLTSQQLVRWGADPHRLGLTGHWPLLVPTAFDLSALFCIGMTVAAAWRREAPGIFGILTWLFTGAGALIQYANGVAERDAGGAQDAWWAMPTISLLGPMLLHFAIHKLRKWWKQDAAEILTGAAGFGIRWAVAPITTLQAWAASRRMGISNAQAAIDYVSERNYLRTITRTSGYLWWRRPNPSGRADALRFAYRALDVVDVNAAIHWLFVRGITVTEADITRATDITSATAQAGPNRTPAIIRTETGPNTETKPSGDRHVAELKACRTKRDRIRYAIQVAKARSLPLEPRTLSGFLAEYGYTVAASEFTAVLRQETGSQS